MLFPVDLAGSGCEFAVGCTYKYLNGGPGAPAFIYVRPDLAQAAQPALQGWMGHKAPFAFDIDYRPAGGVERMRVGTPPVIQMAALEKALSVWDGVSLSDVRTASVALMEQFIAEVEARCPQLTLASPRNPRQRGSHVSFRFNDGYAAMQALIDRGVIGDFRAPDIMRFGVTPLLSGRGRHRRGRRHHGRDPCDRGVARREISGARCRDIGRQRRQKPCSINVSDAPVTSYRDTF